MKLVNYCFFFFVFCLFIYWFFLLLLLYYWELEDLACMLEGIGPFYSQAVGIVWFLLSYKWNWLFFILRLVKVKVFTVMPVVMNGFYSHVGKNSWIFTLALVFYSHWIKMRCFFVFMLVKVADFLPLC